MTYTVSFSNVGSKEIQSLAVKTNTKANAIKQVRKQFGKVEILWLTWPKISKK